MGRIIHFEIPVDNPDRASEFYRKVFGWKINKWGDQPRWLCETGTYKEPGINGALALREGNLQAMTNTISVRNINKAAEDIISGGGEMISEIQNVLGVGFFAYFKDTEGNILGIIQELPLD